LRGIVRLADLGLDMSQFKKSRLADDVPGSFIFAKQELRLSDLHLDETRYKKTDNEGHGPPYFYYTNEQEGLQYEVTQGRVMTITYFATQKDSNELRCPSSGDTRTTEPDLRDCLRLRFRLDCSSERITKTSPVICKADFSSTRQDFTPQIQWNVSKNAKKEYKGSRADAGVVKGRLELYLRSEKSSGFPVISHRLVQINFEFPARLSFQFALSAMEASKMYCWPENISSKLRDSCVLAASNWFQRRQRIGSSRNCCGSNVNH